MLFNFPFAGIYPTIDIYSIFRYKPMHGISMGVGRMLKKFIVYMLWDEQRQSSAMRCQNEYMKLFRSIKRTVLSTFNAFLERFAGKAPG